MTEKIEVVIHFWDYQFIFLF